MFFFIINFFLISFLFFSSVFMRAYQSIYFFLCFYLFLERIRVAALVEEMAEKFIEKLLEKETAHQLNIALKRGTYRSYCSFSLLLPYLIKEIKFVSSDPLFFCWPASRLVLFCVVYGLVNILSVFHIHHRLHFYGHHFHLYFCICFNFKFCFDFFFLGLKEKIFEISCEEQSVHEEIGAYTEEIISNCEILILEDFYQFYTITLLNIMFTKPECQVGLLEYAGFLKAKSVKNKIPVKFNHRINKQLKEKEDNLLNEFLHYAIESD